LFGLLLGGDAPAAIAALRAQRDLGVEPSAVLRGLLDVTHGATLAKVGAPDDPAQSVEEREALAGWAAGLSFTLLHRMWQLLLKGHDEVTRAADPNEAAEMALLRVIHASSLPDPADVIRRIETGTLAITSPVAPQSTASESPSMLAIPADFAGLIEMLIVGKKPLLAQQLHDFTGLVRYAPPDLAIRATRPLPSDFTRDLGHALKTFTGVNWQVTMSDEAAEPSLLDQAKLQEDSARRAILEQPMVAAAIAAFPETELLDYEVSEERSVTT
jgi:DNA polymerase III subunit gamma/tau